MTQHTTSASTRIAADRSMRPSRRSAAKAITASFVGTALEWYDFFLFGTMASIALAPLFFPNTDPVLSVLSGFLSFAVAFIARPIGAVVFGHFGDRLGRKNALIVTVLLMGVASAVIGALPTYETAGIVAPIALTVLRFVQGFATGGEWGGATVMAMEFSSPRWKPLMAAVVQLGSPVGTLLSSGAVAAVTLLSGPEFLIWGWRIPFLASIVLVIVAVWMRRAVEESPEFVATADAEGTHRVPVLELLRTQLLRTITGTAAFLFGNAGFFLFTTFMISYVTRTLELPAHVILTAMTIGAGVQIVFTVLGGLLAVRIGANLVALLSYVYTASIVFPVFWLVDTREPGLIILAMCLVMGPAAMSYAVIGSVLDRLFPVSLKYTGLAVASNLAAVIAGFMPALATVVLGWAGFQSWGPATLALVIALVSITGVLGAMAFNRRAAATDAARSAGE